jgi:hypothetical protein
VIFPVFTFLYVDHKQKELIVIKIINKIQLNFLRIENYCVVLFALLKIKIGSSKSNIVMNIAPMI